MTTSTDQKMKFSVNKDLFCESKHKSWFLRFFSNLLKKSLTENFILLGSVENNGHEPCSCVFIDDIERGFAYRVPHNIKQTGNYVLKYDYVLKWLIEIAYYKMATSWNILFVAPHTYLLYT